MMITIEVALVAALLAASYLNLEYGREACGKVHAALVMMTCLSDALILGAFAMAGGRDARSWTAVAIACAASVASAIAVYVASKKLHIEGVQAFYAAGVVMCASAACVASVTYLEPGIAKEARNGGVIAASALMLLGFSGVSVLVARRRELFSEHRLLIGYGFLAAAALAIRLSFAVNRLDGAVNRLALPAPFASSVEDVSVLVAVLIVTGITLVSWSGRASALGIAAASIATPALLVLAGGQASVGICAGIGILALLYLKTRSANKLAATTILLLLAWAVAASVSPATMDALKTYSAALANPVANSCRFENMQLLARAGWVISLGKFGLQMPGAASGCCFGSIALQANAFGHPVLFGLILSSVTSVMGARARGLAARGKRHTAALPICVTVLCIAYCGVLSEFGLMPDTSIGIPCVSLGFYSCLATLLCVVMVAVCTEPCNHDVDADG